MQKLRLGLDSIRVVSFQTSQAQADTHGTVCAHGKVGGAERAYWTQWDRTCGGVSCDVVCRTRYGVTCDINC